MCGLFGAFVSTQRGSHVISEDQCRATLDALRHRGPDDRGLVTLDINRGQVLLGHTRLAVIDLSDGGHQPMASIDGRYCIVFNGEIYNYRELREQLRSLGYVFQSNSDTEVLLAAWIHWGVGALRQLTGMFAFAVFDRAKQTITLARDPFGIKPLFYSQDGPGIFFASELPALIKLLPTKPRLNPQRAYDYLVWGRYDDEAETFYSNVLHLPAGHVVTFELGVATQPEPQRWWWPSIVERDDLTFEQATECLREMFLSSVRLHLRSDVPLGAALSGGIDSSAVVCAMRHLEPDIPIHTFTYVARGSAVDEEHWADVVNAHVGAISHKTDVSGDDLATDLDDMLQAQGEPFGSTSIYAQYRVFRLARDNGITVTLDGQGADELLAGYHGYPGNYVHSLLEQRKYRDALAFVPAWTRWPGRGYINALYRIGGPLVPPLARTAALRVVGRSPTPPWLLDASLREQGVRVTAPIMLSNDPANRGRRLAEHLRFVLTRGSLAGLLRHGDRNSMRWSIESRVPFLTPEIAEFVLTLPETYLLSPQGETKRIFRAAMRGIVPNEILDRRDKIGFATPERDLLGDQRSRVRGWLDGVDEAPFLDATISRRFVNDIVIGRRNFSPQAWRLINYCRWLQLHTHR